MLCLVTITQWTACFAITTLPGESQGEALANFHRPDRTEKACIPKGMEARASAREWETRFSFCGNEGVELACRPLGQGKPLPLPCKPFESTEDQ
jgi:hypothetical protein